MRVRLFCPMFILTPLLLGATPSSAKPHRAHEIEITCTYRVNFSDGVARRHRAEAIRMFHDRCYFRISVGPRGVETSPGGSYTLNAARDSRGLVYRGSYLTFIEWLRKRETDGDLVPDQGQGPLGLKEFEVVGFSPHDNEKIVSYEVTGVMHCAPDGAKVSISQKYQQGTLFHTAVANDYVCRSLKEKSSEPNQ